MSMSRNALYVLRMVLQGQGRSASVRSLSTAALARDVDISSSSSPTTSSSNTVEATATSSSSSSTPSFIDSFLEPESPEYTTVSLTLPPRQFHADPIPWPTLFPHHHHATGKKQKFCDPLYRLVITRQYDDALRIYEELKDHGVHIQHRHIYLDAATAALRRGKRAAFLRWLELYPNRPATSNHPGLKSIWQPIIHQVATNSKGDTKLLFRFLNVTAEKGLTPTILPPLLPQLAFTLPPHESRDILEQVVATYRGATTSSTSTSVKATIQEEVVSQQVGKWWSTYLRQLLVAGWDEAAQRLYESPPNGLIWDEFTDKVAREELGLSSITIDQLADDSMSSDSTSLATHIRAALHDLPTPNHLAALIRTLSQEEVHTHYPTLLARFERRFTRPPTTHRDRTTPTIQHRLWLHAEIINLQREGRHKHALELFQNRFIWSGLPDHPSFLSSSDSVSQRCYPTIQIITTILPSLLQTLPQPVEESIMAYHHLYLDLISSLPPSLRPTSTTHAVFLRHITKFVGPAAGLNALRTLEDRGCALDEACHAAVLYSLGGRRRTHQMYQLLEEMEGERGVGVSRRTYRGLVAILVKTGLGEDAEKVFWRARKRLGTDDVLEDLVID
ncbi:hypothetical protein CI109_104343 [Kwoniella shandongensis]|uniref:Uncharacterized protein n=1 Tax=Kwoniella shandongensis TaxID=1734106 RepID=A0A5M6BX81_9TREE|nr:uncharacterized protein CI109_004261 [Kwoniella shandongensis]KAA5527444.1 hypothetical protein CI109_004261 [Kwoniella shandongensis]